MFGFGISRKNNKVYFSKADKIIIATDHIKHFLQATFNPHAILRDRDGTDFRSVISINAKYCLNKMLNDHISNEEFEMHYKIITSIDYAAGYEHPLYRISKDQPIVDNSFFGLLGSLAKMLRSLFFHEIYERAPFSSFEVSSEIGYEEMIGVDE